MKQVSVLLFSNKVLADSNITLDESNVVSTGSTTANLLKLDLHSSSSPTVENPFCVIIN
jgi:hypothetical protein